MMRRAFALTVLMLGLGVAAHADILAAGSLYGGPRQKMATCYLFNAGRRPVTIVTNQIFSFGEPATSLRLDSDTCGLTLATNSTCVIAAEISNNTAYTCKFVLSPSAANVRGVFELRAGGGVSPPLQSVDLR